MGGGRTSFHDIISNWSEKKVPSSTFDDQRSVESCNIDEKSQLVEWQPLATRLASSLSSQYRSSKSTNARTSSAPRKSAASPANDPILNTKLMQEVQHPQTTPDMPSSKSMSMP